MQRKGLGIGKGSGYSNIIKGYDSKVHSNSAKGMKIPQKSPMQIAGKITSLPIIVYNGKKYYVDFRLEELRNVNTSEPIKFINLGGDKNSEFRKKLRSIRSKTIGQYYILGVDDVGGGKFKKIDDGLYINKEPSFPKGSLFDYVWIDTKNNIRVCDAMPKNSYPLELVKKSYIIYKAKNTKDANKYIQSFIKNDS
jgi:hypothetical protein